MNQDNKTSSDKWGADDWPRRLHDAIRANQTAQDMFDDCYARFMGVNRTDARCMDIIERSGRITAGQLAGESGLTTGAVTVVIDRLEAAHYVARERDPDDRRKIWIVLTPLAEDLGQRLFSHFQQVGPAMLSRFTPDQLAAIVEFLDCGTRINRDMAGLLEQHIERGQTPSEARLLNARAFQRDASSQIKAMIATLHKAEPGK